LLRILFQRLLSGFSFIWWLFFVGAPMLVKAAPMSFVSDLRKSALNVAPVQHASADFFAQYRDCCPLSFSRQELAFA